MRSIKPQLKAKDHIAKGNKKLPATTWIFNSGSAENCPSLKLGLCQCEKECYARKAERQYPACKPYRDRQEELHRTVDPIDFAWDLIAHSDGCMSYNKFKTFRFNEAGDFQDQSVVDWFVKVCEQLESQGIACYGYTARTDLDLSALLKVATVNVSNDLKSWIKAGANRFKAVDKATGNNFVCKGSCRECSYCLQVKGKTIEVELH